MAGKVRYRATWWQFWRKPEPWWISFPLPASGNDEYEEAQYWTALDHRDTWPPSWTDEADEPAPADITEWALLNAPPPVPETEDEDDRRQAP